MFRDLWIGQSVSLLGSGVSAFALPLIAVLYAGAGPAQTAALFVAETIPVLFMAIPAGIIADHIDRRRTLIATDLTRAVITLAVPVALLSGHLVLAVLIGAAVIIGALTTIFDVVYRSYLPEIVERDDLIEGNRLLTLSDGAARTAGPSIAGLIIGLTGGALAMLLDAASFIVSAGTIAHTRGHHERAELEDDEKLGWWGEAIAGLRLTATDRILRDLALVTGLSNIGGGMMMAIIAVFALGPLRIEPLTFGVLYAVGNVGFLAGAIAADRINARFTVGHIIIASIGAVTLALVIIAIASPGIGLACLVAGRFIGAFAVPSFNINMFSVRQTRAPEAMRGRILAAALLIDRGGAPIGAAIGGAVAVAVGLPQTLFLAAVVAFAGLIIVAAGPVRSIVTIDGARIAPLRP
jgi:MFS family permease